MQIPTRRAAPWLARPRLARAVLMAAAVLLPVLIAAPALAQFSGGGLLGESAASERRPDTRKPSALPGARGTEVAPAAAERAPADMPPTEALFDAVNRGDIAAARDALGRGANVDGRNILGLTPLELAIDLGRNDLTFLLLSMRGVAGAPASPPPAAARQAARTAAPPARATAPAPAPARAQAPVPRPRQVSADPGTPMPQAGFLGFGGTPR